MSAEFRRNGLPGTGRQASSVAEGVGSFFVETYKGLRTMNPADTWNQTHPAMYSARMKSMGQSIINDPYGTLKQSVDVNGWKNDPGKSVGALIPSLIGSAAGGSGAAAKVVSGLGKVGKTAGKLDDIPIGKHLPDGNDIPTGKHAPDGNSRPSGPDSGNEPQQPPQRPDRPQDHGPPNGPGTQPNQPFGPGSQPDRPFGPGSQPDQPSPPDSGLTDKVDAPRTPEDRPDARPEDTSEPDQPKGAGQDDLPGESPGDEFEQAQHYVAEHGDPVDFNETPWDFEPGTDQLPEELTRTPEDFPEADKSFLFDRPDPADTPLYRNISGGDLRDIFENGLQARHPDAEANLDTLNAHVGRGEQAPPHRSSPPPTTSVMRSVVVSTKVT